MIYVFVLNQTMEGRVIPYLKEVRLAGNLPGQLQGTYVRCCVFTCVRAILESTPLVECTQVTSLFRLVTSNFTLCGQLRRHKVLVHLQARHEFFAVRVVCVKWCTRVFKVEIELYHTTVLNDKAEKSSVCPHFLMSATNSVISAWTYLRLGLSDSCGLWHENDCYFELLNHLCWVYTSKTPFCVA